jgi:hypothetical protein
LPAEQSDSGADGLSRRRGKVFGIGLSRTGTRSLAAALSRLGFRAGHYDAALRAMTIADGEVVPDFDLIDAWEALTDIPVAATYRKLDERFADSRFILTVREPSSWLASCKVHYAADRTKYILEKNLELDKILALRRCVYGQSIFSPDGYLAAYRCHERDVLSHFSGRPSKLLVLNICAGAGWDELCGFLDLPPPAEPFPRENSSRTRAR